MPQPHPGRNHLAVHPRKLALHRVFRSYDDILEHCCFAWNKLVDQPSTIMSIGLRDWAHRF